MEIDGQRVAEALQLEVARFRTLMDGQKIDVLCERGTGEDLGKLRVTFYYAGRRARFVREERVWTLQA